MTVSLFRKRTQADVIKRRASRRDRSGFRAGPNCNNGCPLRAKQRENQQRRGEEADVESRVEMEAEVRTMGPAAKECQGPPDAKKGEEGISP